MDRKRKRPVDDREEAWVADEDRFVLQQAKKKAAIRVKEGRAKPIDWLAVTLRFIDPSRHPFDDEIEDDELNIVDPEGVFENLNAAGLDELAKDINDYAVLEKNPKNLEFWQTMGIICKDRKSKTLPGPTGRSQDVIAPEIEKMFASKTYDELISLEDQIQKKLRSREPIDFEYWRNLLETLMSWKARARLRQVSQSIIESQLQGLRRQQVEEADKAQKRIVASMVRDTAEPMTSDTSSDAGKADTIGLDPEPLLKIRPEDRGMEILDERQFLQNVVRERRKTSRLGFIPAPKSSLLQSGSSSNTNTSSGRNQVLSSTNTNDEYTEASRALYEREVARGVGDNEEVFTGEETVVTKDKSSWSAKYKPRKPRYFNRVQMGYEWNKYNQTHYDHDNPPPKVVQGYKFNVFYPDLIDKNRAPTYKIEREHGRKRGQSFAPAGEEDTCLIRFTAGPPYEDIAFRIVDKEWDYSAKRERGFRSSFDKGILQLHFQFKKIFYRK